MTESSEYVVQNVPCKDIRRGKNDRTVFKQEDLEALANSIRENGLAQPITVRPNGVEIIADSSGWQQSSHVYEIVAGERRFRAVSTILGWTTIPAIVRELTDEEASVIMLIENVHRVDLNPMDEARGYQKRIDDFGWTVARISHETNVSEKRIAARLKLLDLASEIQHLVENDQITVVYAETMAPLDHNRQRIASRYLTSTDKPVLAVFRKIVGALAEEQMQEALFDASAFFQQQTAIQQKESYDAKNKSYPVDDSLPLISKNKNLATSIETYIVELVQSGNPHQFTAATIIGRLDCASHPKTDRSAA
jgi:ParB/RepB/Spo0J family partition protein